MSHIAVVHVNRQCPAWNQLSQIISTGTAQGFALYRQKSQICTLLLRYMRICPFSLALLSMNFTCEPWLPPCTDVSVPMYQDRHIKMSWGTNLSKDLQWAAVYHLEFGTPNLAERITGEGKAHNLNTVEQTEQYFNQLCWVRSKEVSRLDKTSISSVEIKEVTSLDNTTITSVRSKEVSRLNSTLCNQFSNHFYWDALTSSPLICWWNKARFPVCVHIYTHVHSHPCYKQKRHASQRSQQSDSAREDSESLVTRDASTIDGSQRSSREHARRNSRLRFSGRVPVNKVQVRIKAESECAINVFRSQKIVRQILARLACSSLEIVGRSPAKLQVECFDFVLLYTAIPTHSWIWRMTCIRSMAQIHVACIEMRQ